MSYIGKTLPQFWHSGTLLLAEGIGSLFRLVYFGNKYGCFLAQKRIDTHFIDEDIVNTAI